MKRKTVRKAKSSAKRGKPIKKSKKIKVLGEVTHYFDKIDVAIIKLAAPLKVGDFVKFQHKDQSFIQIVESMQINHKNIPAARVKSEIGLKVIQKVKEGWQVFKAEQPKLELSPPKAAEPKSFPFSQIAKTELPVKPQAELPAPKPQQKKENYGDVKFLKF